MARTKAVVAMSGGVDSSVAAALLIEQGYDVTGIMLKLWRGDEANHNSGCCNLGAAEDARRVADVLDIPFYVFNLSERFEDSVVRDFRNAYASGETPNPCVRCNQWIKFDALLDRAKAMGADILATGHYARVREHHGAYRLLRGVDARKDQSYVLWMLGQDELRHVRFPVGEMEKHETRARASELGLRTAAKPDSQEICFVRGGDVGTYIDEFVAPGARPGAIRDRDGTVVGTHRGIGHYTIGQRKGLGISLGEPVFVTAINAADNSITIGRREELAVAGMSVREASFVAEPPKSGTAVFVQHRAHGETNRGTVSAVDGGHFQIEFDRPVEAVAPGQSAAIYSAGEPDVLLGGGIIAVVHPAGRVDLLASSVS
ncbi:MAG TPA: tRNA 2-thiouridine(34) synthase MnmA [Actinomycetota bacterium]|nr:tRNA 2-thiouridine(34) synthase MnmA [Actinomycetota bacterium]